MEKRTETGLVMGHAYGVTAVKKVSRIATNAIVTLLWHEWQILEEGFSLDTKKGCLERFFSCFSVIMLLGLLS